MKVDKIHKICVNTIFGRLLINIRKHIDVYLERSFTYDKKLDQGREARIKKMLNNPRFKNIRIFNENLAVIHINKKSVELKQSVACGFTVLKLFKLHIYEMYYDVLKPKFGDNIKLAYINTDSFMFEIKSDRYYQDLLDL